MHPGELAFVEFVRRREGRERVIDPLLGRLGVADEAPGRAGRPIGVEIALGRDVAEDEAQPRDLLRRAQRRGERRERAIGHLDRNRRAILDLDRVHAGGDAGVDARQRAVDVGEHVVGMDRLRQADAAEFRRPFSAPGHLVIVRPAPPGRLDGGEIGGAGEPLLHQHLQLLQAGAEPVLEDRVHPALGLLLQRRDAVDVLERTNQRLLADDVSAAGEHLLDHRHMRARRRTEVDDVEAIERQKLVKRTEQMRHGILRAVGFKPLRIEVAQGTDFVELRQGRKGLQVLVTDAEADDGDAEPAHASASRRTALASAVSANSMAK